MLQPPVSVQNRLTLYRYTCKLKHASGTVVILNSIETIRAAWHANLLWVQLGTADGRVGLGETFFAPASVETWIHEVAAPILLGGDAGRIRHWQRRLSRQPVGYQGSGVEMRGASAIDIALWDLAGQAAGLPLHALLGGTARDRVQVYNTCAGPHYVTRPPGAGMERFFGLDAAGALDDLRATTDDPVGLARALLAEGVRGMKIWPFDAAAHANGGSAITPAQIEGGLRPFRLIRDALGSDMDLMAELHGLWDRASAARIISALEALAPAWVEDPIRMDDVDGLAALADGTGVPIFGSETTATAAAFARLIAAGALDIVSFDTGWCGGLTEARDICALADAAGLPVVPHDCTGPVGYVAGTHLALSAPNAILQEMVRAYTRGWYADVVTDLPAVRDGWLLPMAGPGLGTRLSPAFLAAPGTHRRRTTANARTPLPAGVDE